MSIMLQKDNFGISINNNLYFIALIYVTALYNVASTGIDEIMREQQNNQQFKQQALLTRAYNLRK